MQNKSILEILNAMEKKPPLKYIDKNGSEFKNRRNMYITKLNDGSIKEPKKSTLDCYNVDHDEDTVVYS